MDFWSYLSYQNVDSEVKLLPIDEVGVRLVLLDHCAAISGNLREFPGNKNTFALAGVDRLDNHGDWLLLLLAIVHQVVRLSREDPSFGEEVELRWHLLLHDLKVLGEIIFHSYYGHSSEVVDTLVRLEAFESVDGEV